MCYRGGADAEDEEVGDGGDGDGDAGVLHGRGDHRDGVVEVDLGGLEVVEALHDHEHVINAW